MSKKLSYCLLLAFSLALAFPSLLRSEVPSAPSTDDVLLDAVNQFSAGNWQGAWPDLTKLSVSDTTNDAVFYYLAICEAQKGNVATAEKNLLKAISIDSTNIWYRSTLAQLYLSLNRIPEGAAIYETLLRDSPGDFASPYSFALVADYKASRGQDSLAFDYYSKALAYDPEYAPALIGQAEGYYQEGKSDLFFSNMKKIFSNLQVRPEAKKGLLETIFHRLDFNTFRRFLPDLHALTDIAIETHPEYYDMRELKIGLCAQTGDTLGIINQCNSIIRTMPKDTSAVVSAYSFLGDISQARGGFQECCRYYEKALKLQPSRALTLNNYAYYLSLQKKNLGKALKMSAKSLEKEPENATYLDTYGWILHQMGKDAKAKPIFKRAIVLGGNGSREILLHYSIVLKALGEDDLSKYYENLAVQKK